MEERVLRCSCDVKFKYIENYDDFKQRISFVETEAGNRVAESVGTTIRWLQNIITFISIVTVLWSVDVWIVVILVATCIPAIIITAKFSESEYNNKGFWILEYLMACAYFFEATMQQSLNDVRFFGVYPWLKGKFDRKNAEYIQIKNRVTKKHVLFNAIADIFRSCVYIFILLIAARKIFDNPAVGIGAFMLVFTMASQLQDVTARIFTEAAQFVSNAAYMRDFFSLDELEYEQRDPRAERRELFDIDFKHVSFTYPNTEREIIHDLTLHIREGEKIAIVGENGSGKTTFISLLCALYEPDRGTVAMGGESIYTDVSRTRRTLSAAFQDEAQAGADLLQDPVGDHGLLAAEGQPVQKAQLILHGEVGELRDADAPHGDRPGRVLQPLAPAVGAGVFGHVLLQLRAHGGALGLVVAALQVVHDALEGLGEGAGAPLPLVVQAHP